MEFDRANHVADFLARYRWGIWFFCSILSTFAQVYAECIGRILESVHKETCELVQHKCSAANWSCSCNPSILDEDAVTKSDEEESRREPPRADQGNGLGACPHYFVACFGSAPVGIFPVLF
ncbi:uncharacterized protein CC84DRAFT_975592 [Paraphaeosphaeria sporulosa]|uniref:Uncharacterized protein n=1 Tax=Paraphaeosphaeria sporulosa TaxID=1460663 RepID=A0A177C440_9PLEO|nr:uncharacterized protein CC84DRAFT_975592 [Paraphaeosphaeria sporulosa]OAG01931.1 hypothetical protein CC84DRAFT_975592 [Paraphaeosphaeria sporulosa]